MELWKNFDRLVVFDTETTGIEFGRDRIIEIGAVALENGAERGNFNALVRLPAGQMLPTFITELTGRAWMTVRRRRASAVCWRGPSGHCWWPITLSST